MKESLFFRIGSFGAYFWGPYLGMFLLTLLVISFILIPDKWKFNKTGELKSKALTIYGIVGLVSILSYQKFTILLEE